jgi:hypothetical protein
MIFNRNRRVGYTRRDAANSWLNRIITYGLVFFLLYALYTTDTRPKKTTAAEGSLAGLNYTPLNFGDYLRVKNLNTGEENYYDIDRQPNLRLEAAKPGTAYELEFLPKRSCDIIVDKNLVVAFPDPR